MPTIFASGAAVARVAKRDPRQVVQAARQELALDDFGATALVSLQSVERRASLLLERHGNVRRAGKSSDVGIEPHDVAGDETALLEHADSSQAGGGRKMDPFGEREVVSRPSLIRARSIA